MSDPMNNRELLTRLEIVLNGDGTVDGVKVIRTSGVMGFDVAAVDVVYNAGPFPDPPAAIRSRNGKIYVHWSFHRDERQCATSHTDYYILDNPPAGGDVGHAAGGGATATATQHGTAAPAGGSARGPWSPGHPRTAGRRHPERAEAREPARPARTARADRCAAWRGPKTRPAPRPCPRATAPASRRVERERANADDPAGPGAWPTTGSSRSSAAT